MTYQLESFRSEHAPQYEKETKRRENNIVEKILDRAKVLTDQELGQSQCLLQLLLGSDV